MRLASATAVFPGRGEADGRLSPCFSARTAENQKNVTGPPRFLALCYGRAHRPATEAPMPASRPDNEAIFHAARDIPDPDRRREYVRDVCGGDETRIAHVEALLAAADTPDSLLDRPAGSDPVATIDQPTAESAGTVIGPYKLIQQFGEGGMGTVWMAQQTEPVKRLVAIKLIKAGMDSKQVIARFEAERQALALMDHANIARVLEAGTTGAGRPYFVMDLVKGVPITRYCDEHRLTSRQRLELFLPVCQAVQHAHQKGIIHRDLKPSNVLVALYDGKPVPKVIDFGVAKAAGQSLTDKTLITGFGNIVGTLEYMSPEQAQINQLDIDTRIDIYSLGVLLYELLTGSPPFTRKELEKAGMLEMLRVIREQEPPKPSTKLSTAEGLPTLAANRGTEPSKLTRLVRGELDWIVMKCLEKDRNRRYDTAGALASDVQRYLDDEPVLAGPPSAAYRMRKFLRRHKGPAAAAGLVVLALLGGSIGTTVGLLRADWARQAEATQKIRAENALDEKQKALERATRRTNFARQAADDMYTDVAQNWLAGEPQMTRLQRDFLEKALHFYQELSEEEGTDPEVLRATAAAFARVGAIQRHLGNFAEAERAFRRGIGLFASATPDDSGPPENRLLWAKTLNDFGLLLGELQRPGEAEIVLRAALDKYRQLPAGYPDPAEARSHPAAATSNLARVVQRRGDLEEARRLLEQAVADQQAAVEAAPSVARYRQFLGTHYNVLGDVWLCLNDLSKAAEALAQSREVRKKLVADFPHSAPYRSHLASSLGDLAGVRKRQRRLKDAEDLHREALALRERVAADSPDVPRYRHALAHSLRGLGLLYRDTGRAEQAEAALKRSLAVRQALVEEHREVAGYREELAMDHDELGVVYRR